MAFSEEIKKQAWRRQKGRCGMCGRELRDLNKQAHHIKAKKYIGPDTLDNCVYLCFKCHKEWGHGMFSGDLKKFLKDELKGKKAYQMNIPFTKEHFQYFNG